MASNPELEAEDPIKLEQSLSTHLKEPKQETQLEEKSQRRKRRAKCQQELSPELEIPCALPPRTRSLKQKPTLALDLDETLVHCSLQPLEGSAFSLRVPCNESDSIYIVNVRKRPFLDLFLEHVSKIYEVVIFTASKRAYAERLLQKLDPKRTFVRHRLFREHCTKLPPEIAGEEVMIQNLAFPIIYAKDLRILGRDLSRTVLVDNCAQAASLQVLRSRLIG